MTKQVLLPGRLGRGAVDGRARRLARRWQRPRPPACVWTRRRACSARWPGDGTTAEVAHGSRRNRWSAARLVCERARSIEAFSLDGSGRHGHRARRSRLDAWMEVISPIGTWVNFASAPRHRPGSPPSLTTQGDWPSAQKWILCYGAAGGLGLQFFVHRANGHRSRCTLQWTPNAFDEWYHVAVTRSGTRTFTLYVDGVAPLRPLATGLVLESLTRTAPLTASGVRRDHYWFVNGSASIEAGDLPARLERRGDRRGRMTPGDTPRCAITQSTLSSEPAPATAYPRPDGHPGRRARALGRRDRWTHRRWRNQPHDRRRQPARPCRVSRRRPAARSASRTRRERDSSCTRATFAGATNVSARGDAFETVAVGTQASALSVSSVGPRGSIWATAVTIRAHLDGGGTNRTVASLGRCPTGRPRSRLKRAEVSASGNLSVRHRPTRETEYYATYGGDLAWEPDASPRGRRCASCRDGTSRCWVGTRRSEVSASITTPHFADRTARRDAQAARFVLQPRHPRQLVSFEGRYCHNGSCVRDNSSFRLNRDSKTWVWVYYGDRSIIGWRLDFRAQVRRGRGPPRRDDEVGEDEGPATPLGRHPFDQAKRRRWLKALGIGSVLAWCGPRAGHAAGLRDCLEPWHGADAVGGCERPPGWSRSSSLCSPWCTAGRSRPSSARRWRGRWCGGTRTSTTSSGSRRDPSRPGETVSPLLTGAQTSISTPRRPTSPTAASFDRFLRARTTPSASSSCTRTGSCTSATSHGSDRDDPADLVLGGEVDPLHTDRDRDRRGADRRHRRPGDRVRARAPGSGSAVRADHVARPAVDVLGDPLRGAQPCPCPWGDDVVTYYGVDLRRGGARGTPRSKVLPARSGTTTTINPLLLGLVLERATGMTVSEYASSRLWGPMGAESDASWSLDSERSGFEKLESGFNATPVDYARFGLLYLHGGEVAGTRVVSEDWVEAATAADDDDRPGRRLPVLLVARHRAARPLLRAREPRSVRLRGTRRRRRHRPERPRLGHREPDVGGGLPADRRSACRNGSRT